VLGNHDLHLLAHALGNRRRPHRSDTFGDILAAADYAKLLDWLRHQPLLHRDIALDFTMVHAGLPPQWDIEQATNCARELEVVLRGPDCVAFFDRMYGNEPDRWDTDLTGWDRLRFVVNCLTRMRYCTRRGRLDLKPKGPPGTQDDKLLPWYEVPDRRSRGERIIFGHWATLHLASPEPGAHNVWGLDTGCVWGGRLTAMRLEDLRLFSVASHTRAGPGD
jgi:bis(5'-nucleosyl)-tetraphosphatase (symmetrical)